LVSFKLHLSFFQFRASSVAMVNRENESNGSQVSSPVSEEIVELAVELLLTVTNLKPKDQKSQGLGCNEFIYLVVTLKTRPDGTRTFPLSIPVPHPLFRFDGSQKICLIIGNGKEVLQAAETKIKEEDLPISKVFERKQLMADCRTSEDREKLRLSFDLFMANKAVRIPKFTGLDYRTDQRSMFPVDLTHQKWRGELESACSLACISFNRTGCVANVARVSQSRKEIVENVVAAIDSLVSALPQKWDNIRHMCLKTLGSLDCSLYSSSRMLPIEMEGVEKEAQIDRPKINGEEGITGGLSSKKRTSDAEKTPNTKKKKGSSLEGETGSLSGQDVGDGVPMDDSPTTPALEKIIDSVDLQCGVAANSINASKKKKKSRKSNKTPVRAV